MNIKEIRLLESVLKNYEIGNITGDDAIGRVSVFAPMLIARITQLQAENERLQNDIVGDKQFTRIVSENHKLKKYIDGCPVCSEHQRLKGSKDVS